MIADRPTAIVILSILTFAIVLPPIFDYFNGDPLEVRFVYPGPDRPQLDVTGFLVLYLTFDIAQQIAFVLALMVGIAVLKKQGWAWFMGIGLHGLSVIVYITVIMFMWPYATNDRIAILLLGVACLYLLSRKDARNYLRPAAQA